MRGTRRIGLAQNRGVKSRLATKSGPLVLIPYPTVTVDMGQYFQRSKSASDMERLWIDYVTELAREAATHPEREATVVAIGIHPFVVGTPEARRHCAACSKPAAARFPSSDARYRFASPMDTKTAASAGSDADPLSRWSLRRGATAALALIAIAATLPACRVSSSSFLKNHRATVPFNFAVALGPNQYQIAGYLTRSPGRHPAVLVLNGEETAERCVDSNAYIVAMGMLEACISIPGYGKSSGPSRFVGPQAVEAAHRAVDLLAARPDVDPDRIAVWGLSDGAVAAGLLMDSDPRLRAVILQSGFYDTLKMWPEAPLREKVTILRQVWPSHRVLAERSVIRASAAHLDCSVLIMHGEHDKDDAGAAGRAVGQRAARAAGPRSRRAFSTTGTTSAARFAGSAGVSQENLLAGSSNRSAPRRAALLCRALGDVLHDADARSAQRLEPPRPRRRRGPRP